MPNLNIHRAIFLISIEIGQSENEELKPRRTIFLILTPPIGRDPTVEMRN